jgi:hypothetical protein
MISCLAGQYIREPYTILSLVGLPKVREEWSKSYTDSKTGETMIFQEAMV